MPRTKIKLKLSLIDEHSTFNKIAVKIYNYMLYVLVPFGVENSSYQKTKKTPELSYYQLYL